MGRGPAGAVHQARLAVDLSPEQQARALQPRSAMTLCRLSPSPDERAEARQLVAELLVRAGARSVALVGEATALETHHAAVERLESVAHLGA